jgi:homoserine dehydrogenase
VVELVGGSDGPALALARATLAAGKSLVTANKAMIAHHGLELARAAEPRASRSSSKPRSPAACR